MIKFTAAKDYNLENMLIKKVPWTNKWKVAEDFFFYDDYDNKEWYITIPKWFITDFWSIPRFLWLFLNPTKYVSYIIHDYLYSKKAEYDWFDFRKFIWAREIADNILLEWLKVEWSGFIERTIIYLWVRFFWWPIFYSKK